ncbi:multicopper oxidase domain-containing protein [Kocuria sp. HR5S1]
MVAAVLVVGLRGFDAAALFAFVPLMVSAARTSVAGRPAAGADLEAAPRRGRRGPLPRARAVGEGAQEDGRRVPRVDLDVAEGEHDITPGESLVHRFEAVRSGIWLYHCSTAPMSTHVAAGMFGAVVIDPPGLPEVDRDYLLVQNETHLGPPEDLPVTRRRRWTRGWIPPGSRPAPPASRSSTATPPSTCTSR